MPSTADAPRATRIVVLAPGPAEIIVALGAGDSIVGVGDWVQWPPSVANRPKVGDYANPNLERIVELGTTLFVTAEAQAGHSTRDKLDKLGIEVLELPTATYTGVLLSIERLGHRLGADVEASVLAAGIRDGLSAIRTRAATLGRPRVLVVVGRDPLFVAGPGSFLDELVHVAGGSNVLHDATSPYQMASLEVVLERQPEVIIDTSDNRPGTRHGKLVGQWQRWPTLPAVKNGRVYSVDPVRLAIPGTRLVEMARLVAQMIHPEAFAEPSAEDLGPPK